MYRALGAIALLSIAIAAPVEDAAAQDPVGGAILGGVTGGVIGGGFSGGGGGAGRAGCRGGGGAAPPAPGPEPAVGAVVGGVTGAAIAAQGKARPGGYGYYQQACYQQRGDGAWVAVAPQYCAPAGAAPVAVAPPPPTRVVRDELGDRMLLL